MINSQWQYPRQQSLNRHWSVLLDQTLLVDKKREEGQRGWGGGGDYSREKSILKNFRWGGDYSRDRYYSRKYGIHHFSFTSLQSHYLEKKCYLNSALQGRQQIPVNIKTYWYLFATVPMLELNSFLMQTISFVPINLHKCWPREWKHSISNFVTNYSSLLSWKLLI